jgi:hypothetical protein
VTPQAKPRTDPGRCREPVGHGDVVLLSDMIAPLDPRHPCWIWRVAVRVAVAAVTRVAVVSRWLPAQAREDPIPIADHGGFRLSIG